MKSYRISVLCLVFVVLLVWICLTKAEAAPLSWPKSSGVLCWEAKDGDTVLGIVRIGITRTVDAYYLLTGEILINGATHNIVFGTAKVGENKILITSVDSGKNATSMFGGISHMILDKNTLNGTSYSISHDHADYETPIQIDDIYIDSDTQYSTNTLNIVVRP